ncbi:MAG: hypothetical protein R3325_11505, partial [Thermoanaerobaculia bacterium]|nr:hypothetical protein [Thermoanaerobaculia bacterium]
TTSAPSPPRPTPRPPAETAPADAGPPVYVSSAEVAGGSLELGGIAFSVERPFALINGQVVGPGDRLLGHTVVAIRPDSVELEGPAGPLVLRLR